MGSYSSSLDRIKKIEFNVPSSNQKPLQAAPFKSEVVGDIDGNVIQVGPDMHCPGWGQRFPLASGQSIGFDVISAVDIGREGKDVLLTITLANGPKVVSKTRCGDIAGGNDMGSYSSSLDRIKRIVFSH